MGDSKKAKRLSKEEIKKRLLESMILSNIISEVAESKELNEEAEKMQEHEKAVMIIKQYEDIIKTKKKGIINVAYYQGSFLKDLKKRENLLNLSVN